MRRQSEVSGAAPPPSRYRWLSVAAVLAVLAVWVLVSALGWADPDELPPPGKLGRAIWALLRDGYQGKSYWTHIGASLFRTMTGYVSAAAVGIPLGLLVGRYRVVEAIVSPFLGFMRPIPPIAFISLFIFYFGIGELAKILLIFMTALWYVILNTAAGVKAVPRDLVRAGQTLGFSSRRIFTHIILPASLPHVLTGLRVALALSWALVVAAELIAAQAGLGFLIMDASMFFRIPDVYIGIITIGIVGLILELWLSGTESRLLHWRGK